MDDATKNKVGRPGFVQSKHVGIKMELELEQRFRAKVRELRRLGFRTSKSELIRILAEYWLDNAEDIFNERLKKVG